ncbi:DUF397 domain-containing protein [Streptomyces sp. NPDC003697]
MPPVQNGVRASSLDARWTKSRHSNAEGNCVEVAALLDGGIAVRNSRDPDGPALVYTPAEVAAFLAGAKDGEFDHLV